MTTQTIALLITSSVILLFSLFMLFRNEVVYNERMRLLFIVHAQSIELIENGSDDWLIPQQLYNMLPSYNEMMWQIFTFRWELPSREVLEESEVSS